MASSDGAQAVARLPLEERDSKWLLRGSLLASDGSKAQAVNARRPLWTTRATLPSRRLAPDLYLRAQFFTTGIPSAGSFELRPSLRGHIANSYRF